MSSSIGSRAEDDRPRGLGQDIDVPAKALVLDIADVKADLVRKVYLGPAAYLPRARYAWLDREPAAVGQRVERNLARDGRPGSHERHVALEDIVELGQFVEGVP